LFRFDKLAATYHVFKSDWAPIKELGKLLQERSTLTRPLFEFIRLVEFLGRFVECLYEIDEIRIVGLQDTQVIHTAQSVQPSRDTSFSGSTDSTEGRSQNHY